MMIMLTMIIHMIVNHNNATNDDNGNHYRFRPRGCGPLRAEMQEGGGRNSVMIIIILVITIVSHSNTSNTSSNDNRPEGGQ